MHAPVVGVALGVAAMLAAFPAQFLGGGVAGAPDATAAPCRIDLSDSPNPSAANRCVGGATPSSAAAEGARSIVWTGPTCYVDFTSIDRPRIGLACLESWS